MFRFALVAFVFLTACGADGVPEAPASGVTVSGSGYMGVGKVAPETP